MWVAFPIWIFYLAIFLNVFILHCPGIVLAWNGPCVCWPTKVTLANRGGCRQTDRNKNMSTRKEINGKLNVKKDIHRYKWTFLFIKNWKEENLDKLKCYNNEYVTNVFQWITNKTVFRRWNEIILLKKNCRGVFLSVECSFIL